MCTLQSRVQPPSTSCFSPNLALNVFFFFDIQILPKDTEDYWSLPPPQLGHSFPLTHPKTVRGPLRGSPSKHPS